MSAVPPIRLLYLSHVIAQLVTSSLECKGECAYARRFEVDEVSEQLESRDTVLRSVETNSLAPPDGSGCSCFRRLHGLT